MINDLHNSISYKMRFLTVIIFLGFIIFSGCSVTSKKKPLTNTNTTENQDSSNIETPIYFNDSLRNIKDFSIQVNDFQFDEIIKNLSKNNDTKISLILDTCIGDGCVACKEMYDRKRKTILYLFKTDAGDWGFGNAQYLFVNDTLKKIRDFDCGIADFRSQNTSPSFKMHEKKYSFKRNEVIISEREKTFRGDRNYNFYDTNFTTRSCDLPTFLVNETEAFRIRYDLVNKLSIRNK
jgi:hypothetical protein